MTEPDEALLWAREQLANTWRKDGAPPKAVAAALAGEFDDVLGLAAHDYRAGAAASAERIKELEARVRKLEWVLRGMIAAASNNLPDRSKQHNLEVALEVLKETDQ